MEATIDKVTTAIKGPIFGYFIISRVLGLHLGIHRFIFKPPYLW